MSNTNILESIPETIEIAGHVSVFSYITPTILIVLLAVLAISLLIFRPFARIPDKPYHGPRKFTRMERSIPIFFIMFIASIFTLGWLDTNYIDGEEPYFEHNQILAEFSESTGIPEENMSISWDGEKPRNIAWSGEEDMRTSWDDEDKQGWFESRRDDLDDAHNYMISITSGDSGDTGGDTMVSMCHVSPTAAEFVSNDDREVWEFSIDASCFANTEIEEN